MLEPALRGRTRIAALLALMAFSLWLAAAASASAFTVQGSVEQIDVTGLAPNAQMSLLSNKRRDGVHAGSGLAGRAAVPERKARERLPGSLGRHGRNVGFDHSPYRCLGAVGSEHLQPGNTR